MNDISDADNHLQELLASLSSEDEEYELNNWTDYYAQVRDSVLKKLLVDYPNFQFRSFSVSFIIRSTAKNADVVYSVLNSLQSSIYEDNGNIVNIQIASEKAFFENLQRIVDILSVVRNWRSLKIIFNGVVFKESDFRYLCDYYKERTNNYCNPVWSNALAIKNKYITNKRVRRKKDAIALPKKELSNQDIDSILQNTIDRYIDLYGKGASFQLLSLSSLEKILVFEDSLIVDFSLYPISWRRADDPQYYDRAWSFPQVIIQDLTPNTLFKFNYSGFRKNFTFLRVEMDYFKFSGVGETDWEYNRFGPVNKAFPFLQLQKRLEDYPGEMYHFIILIMEDSVGEKHYGIGYTKGIVHTFILKLCNELENKNSKSLEVSCLPYRENKEFIAAFLSWKGEKKRWRLENKFSYYYEDRQVKKGPDLYSLPQEILDNARLGNYSGEVGYYLKPLNRWKSEEMVYNITKKLFKDYHVIYQYRPYYLSTDSGCMSYDIYICGLKVAIEYQGKQHFEPVEHFGGKESFEKQKQRDLLKAKLSKENGVKLVYVNYWESITPELVKQKVNEQL